MPSTENRQHTHANRRPPLSHCAWQQTMHLGRGADTNLKSVHRTEDGDGLGLANGTGKLATAASFFPPVWIWVI